MASSSSDEHKAQTRPSDVEERILEAALRILRESGLQRLTQVQVSRAAGVRQSHLTYYFPKRDDLLAAVTQRVVDGIAGGVRRAVSTADPDDREELLGRLAASVGDLEHMRMFVAMIVEADGNAALRTVMAEATRHMQEALAEALGGDDAMERARLVLIAMWGLGLHHFLVRPSPAADPTPAYLSWLTEASESRRRPSDDTR